VAPLEQINPLQIELDPPADEVSVSISTKSGKVPGRPTLPIPDKLPVLGLADYVIFPGQIVRLLIDTPAGIRLVDDVASTNQILATVLQKNQNVETPGPSDLYQVGCAVRLLKLLKTPDNTAQILVQGLIRVKIVEYVSESPYLVARIAILEDLEEDSVELEALVRNAETLFQEIIQLSPTLSEHEKTANLEQLRPGQLADLIAWTLKLDLPQRQKLLETPSVKARLSYLLPLLHREQQILKLTIKIQSEVASTFSKTQRDYFLREQLRVIQRELGEGEISPEIRQLTEKINTTPMPPEAKEVAKQELERLKQIPPTTPEFVVIRGYLDWILNLPWEKETPDRLDLKEAQKILDRDHYGLEKVKERLLDFLAVLQLRKEIKGPILCFVGPPGVGKTSLGKSIAEAMGRKFARFSLGGVRDEAEIRGHRRTYVGALPGRIIQILRRLQTRNPVIMLDEIDKIGTDFRGDPAAALLEVLDPEQNHAFVDHYLDIPFDLSRVLFITTANWLEPVHPALRDRLEVIQIPSYSEYEKLQIARKYLIPRQIHEHGLQRNSVKIHQSALRRLIREYTKEAGVRQLERGIATLLRKATRKIVSGEANKKPIVFKAEDLTQLIGLPPYSDSDFLAVKDYGLAFGLAWTPYGGEVLQIEATHMPGTGKLILTGSLGDILKESAQIAVSYLRSRGTETGTELANFEQKDLHIHIPAGAIPKDGPSAGLAILVALASLIKKRPIKPSVAFTGEITLRGRILKVGGIKEKVLAALAAGITTVVLPDQNKPEWSELPSDVKRKVKPHFISTINEALRFALP